MDAKIGLAPVFTQRSAASRTCLVTVRTGTVENLISVIPKSTNPHQPWKDLRSGDGKTVNNFELNHQNGNLTKVMSSSKPHPKGNLRGSALF
jgi:hypothetical protein